MARAGRSGVAAYGCWLASPLFRSTLASFLLLWLLAKGMLGAGSAFAGDSPLTFRPFAETLACLFELVTLAHFIRRPGTDVLLGNIGLGLAIILLPFAVLHFLLGGALAVLAR